MIILFENDEMGKPVKLTDVDELIMIEQYKNGSSLRQIANAFHTNHHRVKRIIKKHGEVIVYKNDYQNVAIGDLEYRKYVAKQQRDKVRKQKQNYLQSKERRYNFIKCRLPYDISLDYLMQFDYEKLKTLNKLMLSHNVSVNSLEEFKQFLEKFYNCPNFSDLYEVWLENDKETRLKPSIDHIVPISKDGAIGIDNLQIMSWFENWCKNDFTGKEWDEFKTRTNFTGDIII